MNLNVDITYQCRNGEIVKIVQKFIDDGELCFRGEFPRINDVGWFHENGRLMEFNGEDSEWDIISEFVAVSER